MTQLVSELWWVDYLGHEIPALTNKRVRMWIAEQGSRGVTYRDLIERGSVPGVSKTGRWSAVNALVRSGDVRLVVVQHPQGGRPRRAYVAREYVAAA